MIQELISRFVYASIFLIFIYYSIFSSIIFTLFCLTILVGSSIELVRYYNDINCKLILILNFIAFYLIIFEIKPEYGINIIFYNSFSDVIQYIIGRLIGKHILFPITSKTLEGYLAGILIPFFLFNFGKLFILINFIGMIGGLFSSYTKRKLNIKHWSNFLGHHGGFNDRLDSISLPIIAYFLVK